MQRKERAFYLDDAVTVARALPGMDLVIDTGESCMRYMITETEAYLGSGDLACHASRGQTPRTAPLWLEGGHLYIYLIYGIYWMLNVVTGPAGDPQAVLIRGAGELSGPGRLTRGAAIDSSYSREDLVTSQRIWIEEGSYRPALTAGPRVGIDYAGEPWVSMPWRFMIMNETKKR